MANVSDIIDMLNEIVDENSSKNLKAKIANIVTILKSDAEQSMRLNKASHELDDLASNNDIDSFTRTQLLGIVGALETIEE